MYCPGRLPHPQKERRGSPLPFPLAGCRVVPTQPPGKKMWGDRRWPICHSWIASRESSSQLVVLVLRPRRGVLAGRVREGAAAAVKTIPGRELRHCMRRQFLRFLLGRASDRPWGPSHRRLNHGSSKEETRKLARHRDKGCKCRKTFGAPCVERAGLFSAASRRGAGRRCAGRFSARGPCDRRFSGGGEDQSELRDAALHGAAVLEEASCVNAGKRPSRQKTARRVTGRVNTSRGSTVQALRGRFKRGAVQARGGSSAGRARGSSSAGRFKHCAGRRCAGRP